MKLRQVVLLLALVVITPAHAEDSQVKVGAEEVTAGAASTDKLLLSRKRLRTQVCIYFSTKQRLLHC